MNTRNKRIKSENIMTLIISFVLAVITIMTFVSAIKRFSFLLLLLSAITGLCSYIMLYASFM
ncbi:hypothetical protein VPHK567_0210 [Vibrio phage K567]